MQAVKSLAISGVGQMPELTQIEKKNNARAIDWPNVMVSKMYSMAGPRAWSNNMRDEWSTVGPVSTHTPWLLEAGYEVRLYW